MCVSFNFSVRTGDQDAGWMSIDCYPGHLCRIEGLWWHKKQRVRGKPPKQTLDNSAVVTKTSLNGIGSAITEWVVLEHLMRLGYLSTNDFAAASGDIIFTTCKSLGRGCAEKVAALGELPKPQTRDLVSPAPNHLPNQMKHNSIRHLALWASAALLVTGSAQAANNFFAAGDLILFFQKPGAGDTVYVALGNAATVYRGDAAGPTSSLQALDIINVDATLTAAFGPGWATDSGIYAGLAAVRSSSTSTLIQAIDNGDQRRTLYTSKARTNVGTVGQASSVAWDLTQANTSTSGATDILAMGNNLEINTTQQAEVLSTTLSVIDNYNPFLVPGIQGTAFSAFSGGVQQVGSASSFGVFGDAGSVEFALDLYRIASLTDDDTIGEVSGVKQVGSFEGTVVVGTNGSVSFMTIPEPSSIALSGLAGLALAFRRRRNA